MSNIPSNRISLPRVTVMGRQLEDTEPDYMAYYTSYEVARDALITKDQEIERLREALERYGRHGHPNCHDLTLKEDGRFGPRNGCLCGLDTALSGRSSPETSPEWRHVHGVLKEAQQRLQANGERHSWMDGAIGIAESRGRSSSQETKPDPYKAVCQGGTGGKCTDPDCEKCWPDQPEKASGQLCDCGEFCKASLELSFNPKCRRLAKGLPVNGS